MFTHRFSIRKNKVQIEVETIARGLNTNVCNLVLRMQAAAGAGSQTAAPPEVACENGVCTLNWKPQRPAA